MNKIAYYVRVSTRDKQDVKYQITALDKLVKQRGFRPNDDNRIIYEEKESGYNDERPVLKQLLDDVAQNPKPYDCVYVTEISRLGRRPITVRRALEVFETTKTNLHIKQLNIDLLNDEGRINDFGRLVLTIFMELSDAEARMLKERSKDGIRSSIMEGKASGGRFLPYGYKKKGKFLVVDEDEAEVVKMIFNLYKSGLGFKAIAGVLNNQGIPTRSQKQLGNKEINSKTGKLAKDVRWSDKTVDDIIGNPMHIGQRRYWGGKENRKKTPEIFQMEGPTLLENHSIFHECAEIRKTKTHKNHLTVYEYLLKDRIVCGVCGRNYYARFKPTPHGDKVYICSSRLIKSGNCGNVGVNISFIESVLFHQIIQTDSILKYISDEDKVKQQLEAELFQLENTKETANKKKHQIEREIQATIDLQIQAKANDYSNQFSRYSKKLEELYEEESSNSKMLKKVEVQLIKVKSALAHKSSIQSTMHELRKSSKNRTRLRAIFLQLFDKIIISPIDNDTILADVFISLNGVALTSSLKLLLDLRGMRLKHKKFAYRAASDLGIHLQYDNNKLFSDIESIKQQIHLIKENDGLIELFDVNYVPEEFHLTIPMPQK